MIVQDIYRIMPDSELITLYDNAGSKYLWYGKFEDIPVKYMDYRIAGMHTNVFALTESELIIIV